MLGVGAICALSSTTFQNPYLMSTYYSPQKTRYTITDNAGQCESDALGWCQTPAYTVPADGVYETRFTQFSESGNYECEGKSTSVVRNICTVSPCYLCPQNLFTWYCLYPQFWPLWAFISALGLYATLKLVSAVGWAVYPFLSAASNTASKTMLSPLALSAVLLIPAVTALNHSARDLQQVTFPTCTAERLYYARSLLANGAPAAAPGHPFHIISNENGIRAVTVIIRDVFVNQSRPVLPYSTFADGGCGSFTVNGDPTPQDLCLWVCSVAEIYQDACVGVYNQRLATDGTRYDGVWGIEGCTPCDLGDPRASFVNGEGVTIPMCQRSSLAPSSFIEITSSRTPSQTPTGSITPSGTVTPSITPTPSRTASNTPTISVTPTTSGTVSSRGTLTATHTPYPNLGATLDPGCGLKGNFDHLNNAVMDLTLLSSPPSGSNYGWYKQDNNVVLGYTDGTEGCYGVRVDYVQGIPITHVFCTNIGPSSVTYDILYDASTSDTNNYTDGEGYGYDVFIAASLQSGLAPRGSCQDDGRVICKRQCNWWTDCRTGTIGMRATVQNTVITRSTLVQGVDAGDTSSHCVYVTDSTMTTTYGSRKLSARLGHPITSEILIQITPDHPYVQRNLPSHPNSGLKVYMGGCESNLQYCQDTFPGPRALTDLTDRSWMYDRDGFFGNMSIDRMYGSEFSLTVSDSKVPTDTCGLDPGGNSTPTVMMTMSDAILNNAITGILFEPRGKDCDYMLIWGPGCQKDPWPLVKVNDACGNYGDWVNIDFNKLGKIPECNGLTSNFDHVTYNIQLHPLCIAYFPNQVGELVQEDFLFDTIRLACTTSLNELEKVIADETQGAWGFARATNFVRKGLKNINELNMIQYYYNIAGNTRRCPDHNIGMALQLNLGQLSIIRDYLTTAQPSDFQLSKVCGNFLNRDVDGTNKGTIECMAAWRFGYSWSLTWPHIIARDHANPPHRFNYGVGNDPVTSYICPAGITAEGCIPPDSDACELGRSQNGHWNQLEWETVAGVRMNDLLPPVLYGTSTTISEGLPVSTTFAGISNPLILQIGERDDEFRSVSSITPVHDPMMCPTNVRLLEVDGYIGSGGGSYAHVQFNNTWVGIPAPPGPMYMAVMGQDECVAVLMAQSKIQVNDPGDAIGQEAHAQLKYGDPYVNMFIPFTLLRPSQTGVAELLVCPYYLDDSGSRLACPLTQTLVRLRLPYSVLIIDPPPNVKEIGHEFEEHECFAGLCTMGWPFGLGIAGIFWIIVSVFLVVIVATSLISCSVAGTTSGLGGFIPKLHQQ